jgi:hypothetical protein
MSPPRLFERLHDSARDLGVSSQDIKEFPQYATAMENAAKAADGYGDSMESATAQTVPFADQVAQATQSMRDQRAAALGAFDAVTQYGDALKAAQDAAAKGKRGLDANTEAGRENRQALSGLAAAWNNQSDAVKNNSAKFRSTRRDFIDTATAMGATEAQARRLAQQLLEIPPSRKIRVLLDSGDALTRLDAIRSEMASIKDKTVRLTYFVNQVNTSNVRAGGGRDGDPSTPYWTGGYTGRGGKFEPAGVVHRGEFVFSADATRGHERGLAMLQKRLRGYPSTAWSGATSSTPSRVPAWSRRRARPKRSST